MKTAVLYTLQILVDEDGHEDACHGLLTEQMQKYAGDNSTLIDWRIYCRPRTLVLADDYEPDESPWPYAGESPNKIGRTP